MISEDERDGGEARRRKRKSSRWRGKNEDSEKFCESKADNESDREKETK